MLIVPLAALEQQADAAAHDGTQRGVVIPAGNTIGASVFVSRSGKPC
jgi:hypothetical protein